MEIFGKRIKELRKEKGLSQKAIAQNIGISQSVYCDYENAKVEPTATVIVKLAEFFNVCTDYLLGRKNWY